MKNHEMTGFHAFWIYVAVKNIHFGKGKFDIMQSRLPNKARFLKSWNDGRKDRDGMLFLKVMERMPSRKMDYIRLMAAYCIKRPTFHVSEILADSFQTYRKNELELNDILATAKSDYLAAILHCYEKEIQPQDMFYGRDKGYQKLPLIFKLYDRGKISANSLIAFNEVFGIVKGLYWECSNIVEEDRIKSYKSIFEKYRPIVWSYFEGIAWKPEIQKYHHHILKYGK